MEREPPSTPATPTSHAGADQAALTGNVGNRDRVILVFDEPRRLQRALAVETPGLEAPKVISTRRSYTALQRRPGTSADQFEEMVDRLARQNGARILSDYRFSLEDRPPFSPTHTLTPAEGKAEAGLDDVLRLIGAKQQATNVHGGGVTIAIIDTGVNGSRNEFPQLNRGGGWAPDGEYPWFDAMATTPCVRQSLAPRGFRVASTAASHQGQH